MQIKTLNMELTTRCNLKCPFCSRALCKKSGHIIKRVDLPISCWDNLMIDKMNLLILCGIFGDTIFYPHLFEFLEYSFKANPHINIQVHTNGSAHDTSWWERLSKLMMGNKITFALDGLEDTHKLYRVGSKFEKVIKNMQTAIDGGCDVFWQFIIFKHNQHQVEEARKLAMKMGCKGFFIKKSFIYDEKHEKPSMFPNIQSKAEPKIGIGKIECRMDGGEVMIMANGDVSPCCEISQYFYNYLNLKPLNLKDHSLQEILNDGYIQKFRSEVEDKKFCQRCRKITKHNYHSVESLSFENKKMQILKKIRQFREQKNGEANKK